MTLKRKTTHILQEVQRQHASSLDVVRVLQTDEARPGVMRVRVSVADLGLQLFQIKRAVEARGDRGGVDAGQLRQHIKRTLGPSRDKKKNAPRKKVAAPAHPPERCLLARRRAGGTGRPRSSRLPAPCSAPSLPTETGTPLQPR